MPPPGIRLVSMGTGRMQHARPTLFMAPRIPCACTRSRARCSRSPVFSMVTLRPKTLLQSEAAMQADGGEVLRLLSKAKDVCAIVQVGRPKHPTPHDKQSHKVYNPQTQYDYDRIYVLFRKSIVWHRLWAQGSLPLWQLMPTAPGGAVVPSQSSVAPPQSCPAL